MLLILSSQKKKNESVAGTSVVALNRQNQSCRTVRLKRFLVLLKHSSLAPANHFVLCLASKRFFSQQNRKLCSGRG